MVPSKDDSDSDIECVYVGSVSTCVHVITAVPVDNSADVVVLSDSSVSIISGNDPASSFSPEVAKIDINFEDNGGDPPVTEEPLQPWMQLFDSGANVTDMDLNRSIDYTINLADVAISLEDDVDPEMLFLSPSGPSRPSRTSSLTRRRSSGPMKVDFPPASDADADSDNVADVSMSSCSGANSKPQRCRRKPPANDAGKEARQQEKEANKAEKKLAIVKKQVEKEQREKLRKENKLLKESEKLQKKAFKEASKPLQGGKNSLDYLRIHVPKGMLDLMGRSELEEMVDEDGGKMKVVECEVSEEKSSVIYWTRTHVTALVERNDDTVKLTSAEEHIEEKDILIQIPKKSFVAMVDFHKQLENGLSSSGRDSFNSYVQHWKTLFPGKSLHFFVYGMEKYFKNQLSNVVYGEERPARAKPVRKSLAEIPYKITYDDMEQALMDMMGRNNMRVLQIETPREFARLLLTSHKAIADRAFKTLKLHETPLLDAISANTKTNGVSVPEDSVDGYRELWIRQLEQFNLVSRDVAITIASLYPSPRLLMKAYDDCSTEQEKQQLFADVVIRRGTERRMGPKLSMLMYRFMCATDGDEILE